MSSPTPTPSAATRDTAHVQDFSVLDLGHPAVSQTNANLVDFQVTVHGLAEIRGSALPIACLMLSHGFAYKARDHAPMAAGLLGEMKRLEAQSGCRPKRDFIVVTIDQRNHGERRWYKEGGLKFMNDTKVFATHLAMTVSGGTQDQQLIMDFLAGEIFPRDERHIASFMSAGFSLAGHVTWRLLRSDPRIQLGVCFSTAPPERLGTGIVAAFDRGDFPLPRATVNFFRLHTPPGAFHGKHILAVHGREDRVIRFAAGQERWEEIKAECERGGHAEDFVQEGKGHVISEEMVAQAAAFIWRWAVGPEGKV